MRIGVDCDGVLTDMSAYILECGERYFKRKPNNPTGYSALDVFGCSERENICFNLCYLPFYCKKWPPRPGAIEVINKLHTQGHKLYEITARVFTSKRGLMGWYSRHLFHRWIKEHGFQFEDVFFCSEAHSLEDKLVGCHRYGIDLMIDDNPEIALYLANNGVTVLLFDTLYNQGLENEKIIRVYNWDDIEKIISKICPS